MHGGDEELLRDIRTVWANALLVNRAGRHLEDIIIDIDSSIADMSPICRWH
ncbi:hypothetical protein V7247_27255 [Priestia megaterium]|uniref:hypothetical protein n=1 Tax=Priestia megaterium TaxID=1404 RepID=UPI003000C7C9